MTDVAQLWTSFASRAATFAADDSGATAIEYGLIAAGIATAIISIVYSLGSAIQNTLYSKIEQGLGG
jgi:pilus assembly protein Flp/PilA